MLNLEKIEEWIENLAIVYSEKKDYLTELDSAIGDADHGINMNRGFNAVVNELKSKNPTTISDAFKLIAMTLIKTVGGASGPLYGTFFLKLSKATENMNELSIIDICNGFEAGYNGLLERGKAHPGDKTMLDVWFPVIEKMKILAENNTATLQNIMQELAITAEFSMKSTIDMLAKKGRASYLGERSIGHQDPGATSSYYMIKIAAEIW